MAGKERYFKQENTGMQTRIQDLVEVQDTRNTGTPAVYALNLNGVVVECERSIAILITI
jgi:hypothetical protein